MRINLTPTTEHPVLRFVRRLSAPGSAASDEQLLARFVTERDEGLGVVGPSVLAAMAMDYPRDRFRVFILDDGKREKFRAFANVINEQNIQAPAGRIGGSPAPKDQQFTYTVSAPGRLITAEELDRTLAEMPRLAQAWAKKPVPSAEDAGRSVV